jgi:hypothetical protein
MTRERIKKLRAKARSTTFEAEATALRAKATELEQKIAKPKTIALEIAAMLQARGHHRVSVYHRRNPGTGRHATAEITYRWGGFVMRPWRSTPPPEIQIDIVVNEEVKPKPRR